MYHVIAGAGTFGTRKAKSCRDQDTTLSKLQITNPCFFVFRLPWRVLANYYTL